MTIQLKQFTRLRIRFCLKKYIYVVWQSFIKLVFLLLIKPWSKNDTCFTKQILLFRYLPNIYQSSINLKMLSLCHRKYNYINLVQLPRNFLNSYCMDLLKGVSTYDNLIDTKQCYFSRHGMKYHSWFNLNYYLTCLTKRTVLSTIYYIYKSFKIFTEISTMISPS